MNIYANENCIRSLHYDFNSELGGITEELLENLELYNGTKPSLEDVANQIGQFYKHLRCAVFNSFYSTKYAYSADVGNSYDTDELSLSPKYYQEFVDSQYKLGAQSRYFAKIKVDDSKLDSNTIRFFNKAVKARFDLTHIFDNPTNRMSEVETLEDSKNGFLGSQSTFELDKATSLYCDTDWMKSEKLERMLIKVYSAFNHAANWQGSGGFNGVKIEIFGRIIYETLFLIVNIFLSRYLSDDKPEFTSLIFIAIYFLKFYNPITNACRSRVRLDDDNLRFLVKVHNKIMSDDYFCITLVNKDFLELDRMGINLSRYVFKLLN